MAVNYIAGSRCKTEPTGNSALYVNAIFACANHKVGSMPTSRCIFDILEVMVNKYC